MVDFEVGVILPCAGSGERLGGVIPKQYCKVLGKPLFMYALEAFDQLPYVKRIALVVDKHEQVRSWIQEFGVNEEKITVVKGEATRHRSIRAGLQSLQKNEDSMKVVVVHDAVRPLVPRPVVDELMLAAERHGAAGLTRPLVSTVLEPGADGLLARCLDRSRHLASETPQAFQLGVLAAAYAKCSAEDLDTGTECLELARAHACVRACLIQGPEELWKVTHKKDIYAAEGCLREAMNSVCIVAAEESEAVRLLAESLSCRVASVRHVRSAADPPAGSSKDTFNTVIFFHEHEIDQENQLLEFATMLDFEKQVWTDRKGRVPMLNERGGFDGRAALERREAMDIAGAPGWSSATAAVDSLRL
ncbi:D-ribitol-5-phosphate cytidylyltransferase-like isoform X2 [Bacillus rossius redtenbacheri]|uniref:D-ribitol-5-phosphate cytidylyltransferase-like isoform X2 n=1 Tax=Bacillus rossius redtenbacheri TaxID=93214 RepID=UPI002FDD39BE